MSALRWLIAAVLVLGLATGAHSEGELPEVRVATRMVPPLVVTEQGQLSGFSIELWHHLAARLQLRSRYYVAPDVAALLEEVQAGRADVGIAAISITPEREKQFDFSAPILTAGLQTMVRSQDPPKTPIKSPEDLAGKRVATTRGSTSAALLREVGAKLYEFSNLRSAYAALLDKKVDAIVFDAPVLLHYAAKEARGRVEMAGPLFRPENYGIVFGQNSRWREPVNKALTALREDGTYQKLYDEWFGDTPRGDTPRGDTPRGDTPR